MGVAAVGLDLEGDAVSREDLEELPAVGHPERLAAAECRVELADATRQVEGFVAAKLIIYALSEPDSSQHAMHRAPQRFVSCQARKSGARYRSTERPHIEEAISGEPDVRLRHHLLGDILELWRFPGGLAGGVRLVVLELVAGLHGLYRQVLFAHFRS